MFFLVQVRADFAIHSHRDGDLKSPSAEIPISGKKENRKNT
jgi:hypothetical protein